jgi:hypothetical protein
VKVTYEFNLPEDQDDLEIYQRAVSNECSLWDIKQYIRNKLKYAERDVESESILLEIRELLPEEI